MSLRPMYGIVSPTGKRIIKAISPVGPLLSIEGKKIAFVWGSFTNGNVLLDALMGLFEKRFKTSKLIKLPSGNGLMWGDSPDQTVGSIAKEARVDAVVVAVGC